MIKSFCKFIVMISLLFPLASLAAQGKVLAFNPACGYLLVQGDKGVLLLKQQGKTTYVPAKDDLINGFMVENYGVNYLKKTATGEIMWVYNGFGWLATDVATNRYTAACGPLPVILSPQSITVTAAAPATAALGGTFIVAATASSGLPVAITTASGGCSGSGSGTATITMASSGNAACIVIYNQAGDASHYDAAPQTSSTTTLPPLN
jgi:hypothetical protein